MPETPASCTTISPSRSSPGTTASVRSGSSTTPTASRQLIFAVAGLLAAAFFVWLSVHHGIYAPGARHFAGAIDAVFGERPDGRSAAILLRKIFSIGAFAIVGALVGAARGRTRAAIGTAAVAVGALSTLIEIVQHVTGSPESLRSNVFDVGCGVVGGALGALAVARRQPSRVRRPS